MTIVTLIFEWTWLIEIRISGWVVQVLKLLLSTKKLANEQQFPQQPSSYQFHQQKLPRKQPCRCMAISKGTTLLQIYILWMITSPGGRLHERNNIKYNDLTSICSLSDSVTDSLLCSTIYTTTREPSEKEENLLFFFCSSLFFARQPKMRWKKRRNCLTSHRRHRLINVLGVTVENNK